MQGCLGLSHSHMPFNMWLAGPRNVSSAGRQLRMWAMQGPSSRAHGDHERQVNLSLTWFQASLLNALLVLTHFHPSARNPMRKMGVVVHAYNPSYWGG